MLFDDNFDLILVDVINVNHADYFVALGQRLMSDNLENFAVAPIGHGVEMVMNLCIQHLVERIRLLTLLIGPDRQMDGRNSRDVLESVEERETVSVKYLLKINRMNSFHHYQ